MLQRLRLDLVFERGERRELHQFSAAGAHVVVAQLLRIEPECALDLRDDLVAVAWMLK